MTYQITRKYAHAAHGDLGEVTIAVSDKGKLLLNGKELADKAAEYLLTYAGRTFQDAYAGAKNAQDALAAFEQRFIAVAENTIGTRSGGGGGVDEFTRVARMIVRKAFKDNNGADSEAREKFMALEADEQDAKLDEWFAGNEEAFRPVVEAEVASRKAERERRKALANATSFKL